MGLWGPPMCDQLHHPYQKFDVLTTLGILFKDFPDGSILFAMGQHSFLFPILTNVVEIASDSSMGNKQNNKVCLHVLPHGGNAK